MTDDNNLRVWYDKENGIVSTEACPRNVKHIAYQHCCELKIGPQWLNCPFYDGIKRIDNNGITYIGCRHERKR